MHDNTSFLVLMLLGFAGIALDLLIKFQEWIKSETRPKISLVVIGTVISILITIVLVYLRDEIKEIFVVTPIGAVLLGYSAQHVFRKIVGTKTEKIEKEPLDVNIVNVDEPTKDE